MNPIITHATTFLVGLVLGAVGAFLMFVRGTE